MNRQPRRQARMRARWPSGRDIIRAYVMSLALFVSGCSEDKGLAAEKRYEMVKRYGTPDERCAAITAVADTYLQMGNEEKYKLWSLSARNECFAIEMQRRFKV